MMQPELVATAGPLEIASVDPVAADEPVEKRGGRYQVGVPYYIAGKWYKPGEDPNYNRVGVASWYGDAFHGRVTANGEVFDSEGLTAAHATLPLPSYVRVTNLDNGRSIIVRVNDRGPFANTRLIDVSERTAEILAFKRDGVAPVRVEYVRPAPLEGEEESYLLASYRGPDAAPERSGVMLAAAEPRRSPASAEPVLLASLAGDAGHARESAVAFASNEPAAPSGPGALRAVETVSSSYDADARIAMAFEIASVLD